MKCDSFRLSRCIKLPVLLILCLGNGNWMRHGYGQSCQRLKTVSRQKLPKQITGIQVLKESDADVVNIEGNTILSYTSIKQPSPLSVILYFPETTVSDVTPVASADADVVGNIGVSRVGDATDRQS